MQYCLRSSFVFIQRCSSLLLPHYPKSSFMAHGHSEDCRWQGLFFKYWGTTHAHTPVLLLESLKLSSFISGPVHQFTSIGSNKAFLCVLAFGTHVNGILELLGNSFQGRDIRNCSMFMSGWAETEIFGNDDADNQVRFTISVGRIICKVSLDYVLWYCGVFKLVHWPNESFIVYIRVIK